jgi:23S rRNA (adenine2503-C2)-methyltransferase
MKTIKHLRVPTGDILVVEGDKGKLEMLSLGDYGKDHNIKADFLGLKREISKVEHTKLLPLSEKWVITISTQYGCSMGCPYCDVPKVGPGLNATFLDLRDQIITGLNLHPEIKHTKRLNVHFARMGEPTWNPSVLSVTEYLHAMTENLGVIHPVVSTMMPQHNPWLKAFLQNWMVLKNNVFRGEAGLQLSINSTNEEERRIAFHGQACTLREIEAIMDGSIPLGRKFTLNFAVAGYEIDPTILLRYFDPAHYVIKLTPMHKTQTALENSIRTEGDYTTGEPYREIEQKLKDAGYDVLVFVASEYEDLGRITCGNAILSGSLPECPYETVEV